MQENNRKHMSLKTQLFYEYAIKTRKTGAWMLRNKINQKVSSVQKLSTKIGEGLIIISLLNECQPKSIKGGVIKKG
jgi:hypothetical protein